MIKTSTHIAAVVAAIAMTVATQGTMLWQFDTVAHQGASAAAHQATAVVKLDTVTNTARRA